MYDIRDVDVQDVALKDLDNEVDIKHSLVQLST